MKIKIEDILFWIFILIVAAIAIWELFGSPSDIATITSIALFIIGSELFLWKKIFDVENKTVIGFVRIKNDINSLRKDFNNSMTQINSRLVNIENLIKRKK